MWVGAVLFRFVPARAVTAARSTSLALVRVLGIFMSDNGCKADGRQHGQTAGRNCHTNVPVSRLFMPSAVMFGMPKSAAQRRGTEAGPLRQAPGSQQLARRGGLCDFFLLFQSQSLLILSAHIAASKDRRGTQQLADLRAAAESSRARPMTQLTLPYTNRNDLLAMLSFLEVCFSKRKG